MRAKIVLGLVFGVALLGGCKKPEPVVIAPEASVEPVVSATPPA